MSTTKDLFCDLHFLDKPVSFQMKLDEDPQNAGEQRVALTMIAPDLDPKMGIEIGRFDNAIEDLATKIGVGDKVSAQAIHDTLQGTGPLQSVADSLLAAHMWLTKLEWVQDDHFHIGFRVSFEGDDRPSVGPIALDAFGADLEFDLKS